MRIGLISDTHVPYGVMGNVLPPQVKEVFKEVDLILHAGDIYEVSVLDELESLAPVLAARGDDDFELGDRRVKERHILNLEGFSLWLVHIMPFPSLLASLVEQCTELSLPAKKRVADTPDIIVFGDRHREMLKCTGEVLLVNPGSATFPNYVWRLGTVALLTIDSGKATAHIVQLEGGQSGL